MIIEVSGKRIKDFNLKSFKIEIKRNFIKYQHKIYSKSIYWKFCKKIVYSNLITFYSPTTSIISEVEAEDFFAQNLDFVFEFPDDYPEEELFYFKLKYC